MLMADDRGDNEHSKFILRVLDPISTSPYSGDVGFSLSIIYTPTKYFLAPSKIFNTPNCGIQRSGPMTERNH
jgi:hypothetical protein